MTEKNILELTDPVTSSQSIIPDSKKGKLMARLVPVDSSGSHLCKAKGWLDNDDPFFDSIDRIIQDRTKHVPRVLF
jgi:hypothetical protein